MISAWEYLIFPFQMNPIAQVQVGGRWKSAAITVSLWSLWLLLRDFIVKCVIRDIYFLNFDSFKSSDSNITNCRTKKSYLPTWLRPPQWWSSLPSAGVGTCRGPAPWGHLGERTDSTVLVNTDFCTRDTRVDYVVLVSKIKNKKLL